MEENQTLRIVVLGKTGVGKSSLANTIYGVKDKFKESASANSKTKECSASNTNINGRNIRMIDTPGLFDTDLNTTDLSPDILKCIEECAPGPHAFLLVLKVEKFTRQEQDVVDIILQYFSEEALKYTTVVFTHGDQLDIKKNIKDWAYENKALKTLIEKCGGRCHVFDNKYWDNSQDPYRNNQYQLTQLLNTIQGTMTEMNGTYYTNKFLEFVLKIKSGLKHLAASVLLGALLGAEKIAKALFERKHPSTDEDPTDEDSGLYQDEEETDTLRIVLLGKTGSGKSSLANTIFGDTNIFAVNHRLYGSVHCQSATRRVNGRIIKLVETPGVFDNDLSSSELSPEIIHCVRECAPGPHAFLLVLKVERFTRHEEAAVEVILKYFSAEALKYTTVVFTHGDLLNEGTRIEDWVYENEALKTLIEKCGGRCHLFDNKYWNNSEGHYRNNQYQVIELLNTIDRTVRENGGQYYTNEMLQQAQQMNPPQPRSFFSWLFGR